MAIDPIKLDEFVGRFAGDLGATLHAATVVLGDKLGLYPALAEGGPQTAAELADRTGYVPRLVEEWLNAQAASGYCEYDPATGRYHLSEEQTACLAEETSPAFVVGGLRIAGSLHKDEERVAAALRGDDRFLARAPRRPVQRHRPLLPPRLRGQPGDQLDPGARRRRGPAAGGAMVADVGCGYGSSTILMAQAYRASRFWGFDYHAGSIEAARRPQPRPA